MEFSGKKLAIFGCGYLGSRVAKAALERGLEVSVLTRNPRQAETLGRQGIQRVVTAELDGTAWHASIDPRQDFVLNCVSSAGGGWSGYRKSYLEGMRSLLQWASDGAVQTLVFTSSTSVYAQDGNEWVTEEDPAEGASEGGAILRRAEMLLENAPPAVARAFILRLGGIYGPGRHHLLTRALQSGSPEEGDERFLNSIYVDDAVSAIWSVFETPPALSGGIFNIVDGEPAQKGEIIRYLHEQAKERRFLSAVPAGEEPRRRRPGRRPSRKISSAKARELLDWRPAHFGYRAGYEPLLAALEREMRGK